MNDALQAEASQVPQKPGDYWLRMDDGPPLVARVEYNDYGHLHFTITDSPISLWVRHTAASYWLGPVVYPTGPTPSLPDGVQFEDVMGVLRAMICSVELIVKYPWLVDSTESTSGFLETVKRYLAEAEAVRSAIDDHQPKGTP